MKRILPLILVLTGLVLTGCGAEKASLDPPEITYGEDISEMGMFVVDPRFTVAALLEDEVEWTLFDDTGELLKYRDRYPDAEFRAIWVHDYHTEEWVKAEDAWYVQSAGFTTPMGWLVGTFAEEADARAFVEDHGGEVMTWDEANDIEWVNPPAPDDPIHAGHATPTASPAATPVHQH